MKNFTVYAVLPNQAEIIVGSFEFRDQAQAAIERYLNTHPTATCYINSETVGWVK
jgi:hypothetical protein